MERKFKPAHVINFIQLHLKYLEKERKENEFCFCNIKLDVINISFCNLKPESVSSKNTRYTTQFSSLFLRWDFLDDLPSAQWCNKGEYSLLAWRPGVKYPTRRVHKLPRCCNRCTQFVTLRATCFYIHIASVYDVLAFEKIPRRVLFFKNHEHQSCFREKLRRLIRP